MIADLVGGLIVCLLSVVAFACVYTLVGVVTRDRTGM